MLAWDDVLDYFEVLRGHFELGSRAQMQLRIEVGLNAQEVGKSRPSQQKG